MIKQVVMKKVMIVQMLELVDQVHEVSLITMSSDMGDGDISLSVKNIGEQVDIDMNFDVIEI